MSSPTTRTLELLRRNGELKVRHDTTRLPDVPCQFCGEVFRRIRRTSRFCSRYCGVRGRIGKCKRVRETVQCDECGAVLERKPYLVATLKRHFCDRECQNKSKSKSNAGSGNPNYRGAGDRTCECCGKGYRSYNTMRRFCSPYCSGITDRTGALGRFAYGREAEYQCASALEAIGIYTLVMLNSRGQYDVVAFGRSGFIGIQVKRSKWKFNRCRPGDVRAVRRSFKSKDSQRQLWTLIDGVGWYVYRITDAECVCLCSCATATEAANAACAK